MEKDVRAQAEAEWEQAAADRRRPYEPPKITSHPVAPAPDLLDSVTGSCDPALPFMRGVAEGIAPFSIDQVRQAFAINQDMRVLCLGAAQVVVTGLEELQAVDVEALGRDKGKSLRLLAAVDMLRHSGDT